VTNLRYSARKREIVSVRREISIPRHEAFMFLRDLENHWALTGAAIAIRELSGPFGARTGAVVRLRGPLGLGRSARTLVLEATEPCSMLGLAEVGGGTLAAIGWRLDESATGTLVELRAEIVRLAPLDRVLWRLGARRWMLRLFARTLAALEEAQAPATAGVGLRLLQIGLAQGEAA
jgi:hypothetical protein